MTYATLQTDVADYLHRTDLTDKMPTLITQAEAMLFRELNLKNLETSTTGTTSGGTITLPSDFAAVTRLTVTYSSTEITLDYFADPYAQTLSGVIPVGYSLEKDQLRLYPNAGTGYAYTLYYIAAIPALSTSNTTNWLLTNAPDLYLYATALEAAIYLKNDAEIARLTPKVEKIIESVRSVANRKGQPTKGAMQVKPRR